MTDESRKKTIAVDLDGTIAMYSGWVGPDEIGEPIKRMIERVKEWLSKCYDVWIFTSRMSVEDIELRSKIERAVRAYCLKHIGVELPVTATKFMIFDEIWDDRAFSIVPNTGLTPMEYMDQKSLHLTTFKKDSHV